MGPRLHLSFCAYKTAWLAPELLVSMGLSPHLWFLHAKNRDFWTRITSLYQSLTLLVVLCMQNSVIGTWKTSLYGSQPSSVVFSCKTATFGPELQVSMGQDLTCCFVHAKQRHLHQNDKSIWVPALICGCVQAKQQL